MIKNGHQFIFSQGRKMICNVRYQQPILAWLILFLFSTSAFAANDQKYDINGFSKTGLWRAVVSVGAGAALSSDVGKSKTFPIVNPVTDEFYVYSANTRNQTVSVFDSFVGAEWAFHPNWSLQLGLGYNQAWNIDAKGSLLQGADSQSADQYSYHYSVLTRQLLAESKLLYRFRERYRPYALLGLGAAFNDASDYGTNVPPFSSFTRQYQNNTQTSFSYVLGLGVDVDVTNHLRLGIGYRFADFGQVKLGKSTIDTTSVDGTLSQTHLYTNEILAQLTFVI
jgi:opacity protein-like surface antigen